MKVRHTYTFIFLALMIGVIIGVIVMRDTRVPSVEAIDQIARDTARAEQARANDWSRFNQTIAVAAFALITMIVVTAAAPLILMLWNRRNDRQPDYAGRFAGRWVNGVFVNPNAYPLPVTDPAHPPQIAADDLFRIAALNTSVAQVAAAFEGGITKDEAKRLRSGVQTNAAQIPASVAPTTDVTDVQAEPMREHIRIGIDGAASLVTPTGDTKLIADVTKGGTDVLNKTTPGAKGVRVIGSSAKDEG